MPNSHRVMRISWDKAGGLGTVLGSLIIRVSYHQCISVIIILLKSAG